MSESKDTRLVWVDLETTGLDPQRDAILEIACVVTDSQLNEIERFESVVRPTDDQSINLFCAKMHTRNGLLQAIAAGEGQCVGDAAIMLASVIGKHAPGGLLAGSTIGFDRSFLAVHMPSVVSLLHYRSFYVSTLKAAYRMWVGDIVKIGDPAHRAMADILGSIEECRTMRNFYTRRAELAAEQTITIDEWSPTGQSPPIAQEEEPREVFERPPKRST